MTKAAFFDLDGTIVSVPSEKILCYHLFRRNKIKLINMLRVIWIYFRYDIGIITKYDSVKRLLLNLLLRDIRQSEINQYIEEYFLSYLVSRIYSEVHEELHQLSRNNFKIYLISSTLDVIVNPIANYLGVDEKYCTELEIIDGCYTGNVVGLIYYGEKKREIVNKLSYETKIDLSQSYAFGDSFQDVEMLRIVGNPVAVNPDTKLGKIARRSNWRILNAKQT